MAEKRKFYEHLLIENRGKLQIIKFNNPKKKNALNRNTYKDIVDVLDRAEKDDSVTVVAFTGVGNFYSSGNDITGSTTDDEDMEVTFAKSKQILFDMTKSFYSFPKLLIAVVNGPCIGIAATTAALCDVIYCTKSAYFQTPFTQLGLCPEACSSITFPQILGRSKATEMLLLNHKMSCEEALKFNFVAEIFENNEIETKIWPKILKFTELPINSLKASKRLVRLFEKDVLEKVTLEELKTLNERWRSEEFLDSILKFMTRKSKL